HATFQVGVGVPMPASSEGQAVRSARVVLAGAQPAAAQSLQKLMQELARHWVAMDRPDAEYKKELVASLPLLEALPGTVPRKHAADAAEYDALARKLRGNYESIAASDPKAHPGLRRLAEEETCLRCHVKFRDEVVSDLS